MPRYVAPSLDSNAFHCPHCGVYAHHEWGVIQSKWEDRPPFAATTEMDGFKVATCQHCDRLSLWQGYNMVFPRALSGMPPPSEDMPYDLLADYQEASDIAAKSPRGAAALLRLVLQKLVIQLGEEGSNLNADIANLVKRGLPIEIQQALDIVRVVGNNAVHPGQMDISDDFSTVSSLFDLVNLVIEYMIVRPRQIREMYQRLPPSVLEAIARRDNPNPQT